MNKLFYRRLLIFIALATTFLFIRKGDAENYISKEDMPSEPFVCIKILGGLGNQMWQYAAATHFARTQGAQIYLDLSEVKTRADRPFQLDIFKVSYKTIQLHHAKRLYQKIWHKLNGKVKIQSFFEQDGNINDNFFKQDTKNGLNIHGYFSCPGYLKNSEGNIKELYTLKHDLSAYAQEISNAIKSEPVSVSIHIRRGDYLKKGFNNLFHAQSLDYYQRAITLMKQIHGSNIKFFVFSDDYEYATQNFKKKEFHVVKSNPEFSYEDMVLMSKCQHHIIANSTYSIWGAILNTHPHSPTVIAPFMFHTREHTKKAYPLDLYKKEWIIVQ